MHCRVRYLLDFDLKIRSGQVWSLGKGGFSDLFLKLIVKKNPYKCCTQNLNYNYIEILCAIFAQGFCTIQSYGTIKGA
jgi:hypothetical protein